MFRFKNKLLRYHEDRLSWLAYTLAYKIKSQSQFKASSNIASYTLVQEESLGTRLHFCYKEVINLISIHLSDTILEFLVRCPPPNWATPFNKGTP